MAWRVGRPKAGLPMKTMRITISPPAARAHIVVVAGVGQVLADRAWCTRRRADCCAGYVHIWIVARPCAGMRLGRLLGREAPLPPTIGGSRTRTGLGGRERWDAGGGGRMLCAGVVSARVCRRGIAHRRLAAGRGATRCRAPKCNPDELDGNAFEIH